jgi:hypothetical protein
MLERIHSAWRGRNWVVSLLTLDVSGAFDNVNHIRLLHNLRKRQVPELIVNWISSFLGARSTTMTLLEGPMGTFDLRTGIPQGSPLSLILYLFFNADLIDRIQASSRSVMVTGYIDDICILTWGKTASGNCRGLLEAHQLAEHWERTHASRFAPKKYQLIHMHSGHPDARQPDLPLDVSLHIRDTRVKPEKAVKYLGVWLDEHLSGREQVR